MAKADFEKLVASLVEGADTSLWVGAGPEINDYLRATAAVISNLMSELDALAPTIKCRNCSPIMRCDENCDWKSNRRGSGLGVG